MGRAKEGDEGFKPETRTSADAWPSFMVEVVVLERLQQLRNDAWFWSTKSGGETRIVLIMAINTTLKAVTFERWEDVPRTGPAHIHTYL